MIRSLVCLLLLAATGCAPGPGTMCDGWRPIRPEASDVEIVSDSLAEQILGHNEHGASVCGLTAE